MKKIKQFIKNLAMFSLTFAVVVGVGYGAYWYHIQENTMVYQANTDEVGIGMGAVEVADDVSEAARMLAEAKAKLTAEEEKLVAEKQDIENYASSTVTSLEKTFKSEKQAIESDAAAKVSEIEKQIEEINKVRLGFSTTPGQQQSSTQ